MVRLKERWGTGAKAKKQRVPTRTGQALHGDNVKAVAADWAIPRTFSHRRCLPLRSVFIFLRQLHHLGHYGTYNNIPSVPLPSCP